MKIRNPRSRYDLDIKRNYRVLEVGGGHNPYKRSNVVVDKFVDSNYHRSGNIKTYKGQQFIEADGENLPFDDKSFDYVVCCQVLEHVENPGKFIGEQVRVAPKGYIETPSLIGEFLIPKESHRWVIQEIDKKIVMYEKEKIGFEVRQDFGVLFQKFMPKHSIGYKILERTHYNLQVMNYEWENDIEFLVNPDSSYYMDFFTKPWDERVCNQMYGSRSFSAEAISTLRAAVDILRSVVNSKVLKKGV